MSINYCNACERIVEGDTETKTDEHGREYEACCGCGEEVWGLKEDAPDPAFDKSRQVADRIGDE